MATSVALLVVAYVTGRDPVFRASCSTSWCISERCFAALNFCSLDVSAVFSSWSQSRVLSPELQGDACPEQRCELCVWL